MRFLHGLSVCFLMLGLPSATVAASLSHDDIEAIGRVAYAESGSFLGRLAVIETVLNRLHDGKFGGSVQSIIDAPSQFEPVTRVGGWRNLPPLSPAQRRDVQEMMWVHEQNAITIAKGATFFQNEKIVADRAARGVVRKDLVGFNGMPKVAEYGGHTFYRPAVVNKVAATSSVDKPVRRVAMMVIGGE